MYPQIIDYIEKNLDPNDFESFEEYLDAVYDLFSRSSNPHINSQINDNEIEAIYDSNVDRSITESEPIGGRGEDLSNVIGETQQRSIEDDRTQELEESTEDLTGVIDIIETTIRETFTKVGKFFRGLFS